MDFVRFLDADLQILTEALKKINWNWLYDLQSGSETVECLYSGVLALLDKHLPVTELKVYSSDKS